MRKVHLDLKFLGPWQGTRLTLFASTTDGPEAKQELSAGTESASITVAYGTLCRIRLLDMDDRGGILQQFRKVFVACDLLPKAEAGERISVVGLRVE